MLFRGMDGVLFPVGGLTSVATTLHKIPPVFPMISFGKVGYDIEAVSLGNGHLKERIFSKGGVCHESRSKHCQRNKSGY